jgi:predicted nucleic acid-binding protein
MDRTFVDTNVWVYADDLDAGDKRKTARRLIDGLVRNAKAVVSTQVLQEFYVVATRKLAVEPAIARRKVELLARLDVVRIDEPMILEAIDLQRLHPLSFWDALVIGSAARAGCSRLLTEDMQHGRTIAGVRIENPFA